MLIGIDASSFSIACGIIDEDELFSVELFATKKLPFDERFNELAPLFDKFLRRLQPEVVYIEAIPYVNSQNTVIVLSTIIGLIKTICCIHDIPYVMVQNLAWKKGIGLKGTGPRSKVLKEDTQKFVTELYGITDQLTENLYDAIGIATYGLIATQPDRTDSVRGNYYHYVGTIQTE